MNEEYIYGQHPIEEVLTRDVGRVEKVYFKDGISREKTNNLINILQKNKIPFSYVPEAQLNRMVREGNTQGMVAAIRPIPMLDFTTWAKSMEKSSGFADKPVCVVLFDELQDPFNVGAIIRSGTAFGVSAFLFPKHNQVGLTSTVMKAAAGTVGVVPLVSIGNVNTTLRALKDYGFWIYGLSEKGDTVLSKEDFPRPTCIVVGNEDVGIRAKTFELCDTTLSIPMDNNVDSLNVSVSTALALYEWKTKNNSQQN